MRPEDWIALAAVGVTMIGIVATTIISIYNSRSNRGREREQQARDDLLRKEQQQREDKIREEQRIAAPHIEFSIDCNIYGPEKDYYLAEFLLTADNKGLVQQQFEDIFLRVRGIERDVGLDEWKNNEPRLAFPKELGINNVKVVPNKIRSPEGITTYKHFFVEPGVKQVFTYITRIPSSIKYIAARAAFHYDPTTPHTTERVFRVQASEATYAQRN